MLSYINYNCLEGDKLDADFKKWCMENGATESSKIRAVMVSCITGHDAYLVEIINSEPEVPRD